MRLTPAFRFMGKARLDDKVTTLVFYPVGKKKPDYLQTEADRLRYDLKRKSSTVNPPSPFVDSLSTFSRSFRSLSSKAFQPYVYNDLAPYFDTSNVRQAMQRPTETLSSYYSRVTALRVVEPWESYAMDYGVHYDIERSPRPGASGAPRP